MKVIKTPLIDCVVIEPQVYGDQRGFFLETFQAARYADEAGIELPFVQDNQSSSGRGVLRGLHYQISQPQGKLVRVFSGCVFDVAVDLRRSSPTFGRWTGAELSADNRRMIWVPPGFGHGFYVLSEQAEFVYKCTDYYSREDERVIRFDDADIGIRWPLIDGVTTIMSDKDLGGAPLAQADLFD